MSGAALRVLVTAASRHGSTHEIADALARSLAEGAPGGDALLVVSSVPAEHRPDPSAFDAVVLGGAVYAGRWLDAARDLATVHTTALRMLSFGERAMATAMRAPVGDLRDWAPVRAWAVRIASALSHRSVPTSVAGTPG
ncbi:flavodoxin domain-containing protein [Geodermatophilus sp. SYSU D01186]